MASRGYNNYHGKKNNRRTLLVILLVLVLLASGGYLLLQDYIVYDSQGNASLALPFFQREEKPTEPGGVGEHIPIEIIESADSGEPPASPAAAPLLVTERSLYGLRTGETVQPDAGDNALVVELKDGGGTFFYQSELAAAGAVDAQAVSRSSVSALLPADRAWTAVAAIHCFHDSPYAFSNMEGAGICQSTGYIWYDSRNTHWLEPSKQGTKAYLCAVARECRDMGFDEILLRSFGYPTQGKLSKIDYSAMQMSKEESLELFLTQLREELGEDVLLAVELTQDQVLTGHEEASGVELARIVPLVDHLFVTGAGDAQALEAAVAPLLEEKEAGSFLVLE